MSKTNLVGRRGVILTAMLLIFGGMVAWYLQNGDNGDSLKKVDAAEQKKNLELTAWVVDWQWQEATADFNRMTDGLSSVQAFAAYFDESDKLLFTDQFQKALPVIHDISKQGSFVNVDLTIVNDRVNKDGTQVQKDPAIVSRLLATDESREKHIKEIMDAVISNNFHGVEIDYEKIDRKDWYNVIVFYRELYYKLHAAGKSLRVVLEPRTPIEEISLPEGPTYVMMAYNLYGTKTGPGPKADPAFIEKLANRLKKVPGNNMIALALGGFDWSESGKVTSVTENQAVQLAQTSLEPPKRDEASGSLSFQYVDKEGITHTVWYADEVTLSQWIGVARNSGYDKIALWRLGDLGQGVLDYVNE